MTASEAGLSPLAHAVLTANARARCLREWDHVNDPPCHPDDVDWNGCYTCVHRKGVAAVLGVIAAEFSDLSDGVDWSARLYDIIDELTGSN